MAGTPHPRPLKAHAGFLANRTSIRGAHVSPSSHFWAVHASTSHPNPILSNRRLTGRNSPLTLQPLPATKTAFALLLKDVPICR